MIVAVTGGRDYQGDVSCLKQLPTMSLLIEGGAQGADRSCRYWANANGIHVATVNAMWKKYGNGAGNIRNRAMLSLKPDLLVAFPGGSGTQDMINAATENNVQIWKPYG